MKTAITDRKSFWNPALMLAAATGWALAGCSSQQGATQNREAVETPNATRVTDDNTQSHFERAFPSGDRNSSLILLEQNSPRQVHMNRPGTFEIKVTNLTDQTLHNVMLSSTNPQGFQTTGITGGTTQPSKDGSLGYTVGDLGPKESRTLQVTGMATQARKIDTCYTATFDVPKPTMCTAMDVINPRVTVAVRAPADADICQGIDYLYTIANTGSGVARNVVLHEDLPDGLSTVDGHNVVNADVGDIPQGENRTVTAHLKAARTGSFKGQVTASSQDDSSQAQSTVTAVHAPALELTLKGGSQDYVGKQVAYQAILTNKGDAPARNAKLQINRTGVGSVNATGADQSGIISLGTLEAGASKTVDLAATSDEGGTAGITANASSDCASPVSQAGQVKFMTIPALLLETVDEVDPVRVGDTVVYDVKVTNQGSGPDSNVAVKAVIPDGEEFISATGSSDGTASGQNLTFAPIAHLDAKQSVTWKISVKATKAADVSFKTSVTSDGIKTPAEKTEPTKLY